MSGRDVDYLPRFNAGAEVGGVIKKLVIPISNGTPAGADEGWVWLDTADVISLAYHDGTEAKLIPLELDEAAIQALFSVTDTSTLNLSYVAGVISGVVLDSPTVGGQTPAALQTTIVNAIVAGAGSAWDTLLEIKAFIEANEDLFDALVLTVAGKARFKAGAVPNGATPQTINHALALADKRDCTVEIKDAAGEIVEYGLTFTDANNISVIDETGTAIPTGLRYFITAAS